MKSLFCNLYTASYHRVDTPSILAKKRDGQVLSEEEIYGLVKGIVNGDVGVDQVGAFLMATYINGMQQSTSRCLCFICYIAMSRSNQLILFCCSDLGFTDTETAALTEALMHSGETLKWAGIIDDDQISKVSTCNVFCKKK